MRNEKGQFVKGEPSWNKGLTMSDETKKKMSDMRKGKTSNTGRTHFKKGRIPWNKGAGVTTSCIVCGKEFYHWRVKSKKFLYCSNRCNGIGTRDEKHPMWKGGTSNERKTDSGRKKHREWRVAVYERDNYTCQICGEKGGRLNADHIKSWAKYPESRYDIDNGRTLCINCHQKTDNYGRLGWL